MANVLGLAVPGASQLDDQYLALNGVLFRSTSPYVAVVDLQTGFGPNHAISNPNGIGGVNAGGLSYAAPIEMSFFDVTNGSAGVTDFVSIRGDQIPIAGTATLQAFGLDGTSLGSVTANDVVGGLTLSLTAAGIHRVVLTETSGTIAFDNLAFNTPTAAPEPSTLLLFAAGVVGLFARSKRGLR
jgi:hypothetical protein